MQDHNINGAPSREPGAESESEAREFYCGMWYGILVGALLGASAIAILVEVVGRAW